MADVAVSRLVTEMWSCMLVLTSLALTMPVLEGQQETRLVFSAIMKLPENNCSAFDSFHFVSESCLDLSNKDRLRMRQNGMHVCSVTCSKSTTDVGTSNLICFKGAFVDSFSCKGFPRHVLEESTIRAVVIGGDFDPGYMAAPPKDTQSPLLICPSSTRHIIPSELVNDQDVYRWSDPVAIDTVDGIIIPQKEYEKTIGHTNNVIVTYQACDRAGNCARCTIFVTTSEIVNETEEVADRQRVMFLVSISITVCLLLIVILRQRLPQGHGVNMASTVI